MEDVEKHVIGKVMRRLIPFLILCYFVAYLDRVNVSFAKLHMDQALGFSEAAFGLGAGLFFVAYFLFEVPSNLLLERVGARLWIARIMISWGIVSAAFAFIPSIASATGISYEGIFYTLRLLLGACEAGFFPGIIFYLTLWFPAVYRARVVSLFMLAIPISSVVGSPISGMLLNLTGWGLDGWQWLFIIEALPSILVGLGVVLYLTDFPREAHWLQKDEIAWLENVQATEKQNKEKVEHLSLLQALTDVRILLCAWSRWRIRSCRGQGHETPSVARSCRALLVGPSASRCSFNRKPSAARERRLPSVVLRTMSGLRRRSLPSSSIRSKASRKTPSSLCRQRT